MTTLASAARALERAIATGTNKDVALAYAEYLQALRASTSPTVRRLIPEVEREYYALPA